MFADSGGLHKPPTAEEEKKQHTHKEMLNLVKVFQLVATVKCCLCVCNSLCEHKGFNH